MIVGIQVYRGAEEEPDRIPGAMAMNVSDGCLLVSGPAVAGESSPYQLWRIYQHDSWLRADFIFEEAIK